jgi:ApaG protein
MYREITKGIQIDVVPAFEQERSKPDAGYFFFSYTVKISNHGEVPAQLLARHWIITDGTGRVEEVIGDGVIGEQPKLAPGESYEYTSFCPLPTPTGNMRGYYRMVNAEGEHFEVKIPLFFLRDAQLLH